MGGGGFVAGPGRPGRASLDRHAAGADRGRQPPRPRQPPAGGAGAARLPRLPDRRAARGSATWSPAGRCPRRSCGADRDAARASASGSRPRRAACWSWAAARAPARSTCARSRPSPSARGRDFHVVHLAGRRDFDELEQRLAAAPHARALHAARLRARPRRLPRRLRPGPRPLGRLDLRGRRGRAAGDPRPLPARHRRPPERQRRLDGRGRRGGRDRGRAS